MSTPPPLPPTVGPTTTYPAEFEITYMLTADGVPVEFADSAEALNGKLAWMARHRGQDLAVTAYHRAPDGRAVTMLPEGVPGQPCESSVWFHDEGRTFRETVRVMIGLIDPDASAERVLGLTPVNRPFTLYPWLRAPEHVTSLKSSGFRVYCGQPYDHDGPCSNGPFRWTVQTGLIDTTPEIT